MSVLRWRRRLRARVFVAGLEDEVEIRGWIWVLRSESRVSRVRIEVVRLCWSVRRWERVVSCWVIGDAGVVELGGRNLIVVVVELRSEGTAELAEVEKIVQALRSRER